MKTLKTDIENKTNTRVFKRLIAAALACVLALCLLAGCATKPDEPGPTGADKTTDKPVAGPTEAPAKTETFSFKKGSTEVVIGAEAASILAALGPQDEEPYESESCALEGLEITYFYPGFDLYTYKASANATEYITGASFWDDTIETGEGLYIGAPASKVESLYGVTIGDSVNIPVKKGNCELLIVLENSAVKIITYNYPAELIVGG
ncbi:MAG: hypothetical protein J6X19_04410 [Clostridia bacterium]|nr:hypothetical protein [Clostridia bacterium]